MGIFNTLKATEILLSPIKINWRKLNEMVQESIIFLQNFETVINNGVC